MRYLVICALVIVIVGITCAYEDREFAALLKDEIKEFKHRELRSVKHQKGRQEHNNEDPNKKKKNRRSCCGEHDLKVLWSDGSRDIKEECFKQAKEAAAPKHARKVQELEGFINGNHTKDEYVCVVQCIGQKKEVLDYMGNVNKKSMSEYVKASFAKEPWKTEIADAVLDKCFAETQKPSEGDVSTDTGAVSSGRAIEAKCNPNGISFIHCLWREMQLNCPADKLRNNRKCNKLRERLRQRDSATAKSRTRKLF